MSLFQNFKFLKSVKAAAIAIVTALVFVLVFSFIVKLTGLSGGAVKVVNQFIKFVSLIVGCLFALGSEKGLISGCLAGLIFGVITYFLFGLISGGVSVGIEFIWEVMLCCVIGCLSGVLAVNVKKR